MSCNLMIFIKTSIPCERLREPVKSFVSFSFEFVLKTDFILWITTLYTNCLFISIYNVLILFCYDQNW